MHLSRELRMRVYPFNLSPLENVSREGLPNEARHVLTLFAIRITGVSAKPRHCVTNPKGIHVSDIFAIAI